MVEKIKSSLLNLGLKFISTEEKLFRMFLETSPTKVNEIVILPAVKLVMEKVVKRLKNKTNYGGPVQLSIKDI